MTKSPQSQSQTAALLLGIALRKSFPKEDYLGSGVNRNGFYAEFAHSGTFHEDYLPLLETAMKKESLSELHEMEMLASNAQTFFIHKNEKKLAERLEGARGTVQVAEMGEYVDLYEYPPAALEDDFSFTLFSMENRGKITRVLGRVFSSDKEKKIFLKKWRAYPKSSHISLASEMELYSQMGEEIVWHHRGMLLKKMLKQWWATHLEKWGVFEVGIDLEMAPSYAKISDEERFSLWTQKESLEEDLFPAKKLSQDRVCFFFKKGEKETNRAAGLLCIKEFCQIFAIDLPDFDPTLSHMAIPLYDTLGRAWPGPEIWIKEESIQFTLISSLERFIAILLEKFEGQLPFWIVPEQVRVFPLKGGHLTEIKKILSIHQIRATFDTSDKTLSEKMHRALRAKVPYVIVVGKREEQTGRATVRAYGKRKEETLTLEQLEALLAKRKTEV